MLREEKNLFDFQPIFRVGEIIRIKDNIKISHKNLKETEPYGYIFSFWKDYRDSGINHYTIRPIQFPQGGMGVMQNENSIDKNNKEYFSEDDLSKVDEETKEQWMKQYPRNKTDNLIW